VKTGDLTDGPLYEVPESITELGMQSSSAKRLPKGTLLVAMYGATIGKLGLLTFEAATNQACAALLPRGTTADLLPFVFQFLLRQRDELRRIGQGGAQPNISQGILKDHGIPLPPLNEQRRIVAKLEALQSRSRRAREALDAVPPLLEKLRRSILAAAFRGDLTKDWRAKHKDVEPAGKLLERIRAKGRGSTRKGGRSAVAAARATAEGPVTLPATWTAASLHEVAPLQPGYAFRSSEFTAKGVRLLRGTNIGLSIRFGGSAGRCALAAG
jgi:type I restriction enzyme S subunit